MVQITISEKITQACPDVHILAITCNIHNTPSDPQLWEEITQAEQEFRKQYQLSDINKIPAIQATRQAYKRLGKDPTDPSYPVPVDGKSFNVQFSPAYAPVELSGFPHS